MHRIARCVTACARPPPGARRERGMEDERSAPAKDIERAASGEDSAGPPHEAASANGAGGPPEGLRKRIRGLVQALRPYTEVRRARLARLPRKRPPMPHERRLCDRRLRAAHARWPDDAWVVVSQGWCFIMADDSWHMHVDDAHSHICRLLRSGWWAGQESGSDHMRSSPSAGPAAGPAATARQGQKHTRSAGGAPAGARSRAAAPSTRLRGRRRRTTPRRQRSRAAAAAATARGRCRPSSTGRLAAPLGRCEESQSVAQRLTLRAVHGKPLGAASPREGSLLRACT